MIDPNASENLESLEAQKERNIYAFVDIVRVSQDIKDVLNKLIIYGHLDYTSNT